MEEAWQSPVELSSCSGFSFRLLDDFREHRYPIALALDLAGGEGERMAGPALRLVSSADRPDALKPSVEVMVTQSEDAPPGSGVEKVKETNPETECLLAGSIRLIEVNQLFDERMVAGKGDLVELPVPAAALLIFALDDPSGLEETSKYGVNRIVMKRLRCCHKGRFLLELIAVFGLLQEKRQDDNVIHDMSKLTYT
jgi:hypothetical protein